MQHLDEGTIHSWLDGALSADEAAQVGASRGARGVGRQWRERGLMLHRRDSDAGQRPRDDTSTRAERRIDSFVWRVAATVLVLRSNVCSAEAHGVKGVSSETSQAVPVSGSQTGTYRQQFDHKRAAAPKRDSTLDKAELRYLRQLRVEPAIGRRLRACCHGVRVGEPPDRIREPT
jgi:hypothetical protein